MSKANEHKPGYKHTPLGWIPEEWDVKKLHEITSNFKSGAGITSSDIFDNDDFPVYGGNGLRGFTNTFTHDGEFLLIGRQGALCGNIILVNGKNYISEHAIAVSVKSKTDLNWLGFHLIQTDLNRLSESSAQPGLAVNKLIKLKVPYPPLPEQRRIAAILSTWDEAITKSQQLITQLQQRNKGLIQQLLTPKEAWQEVKLSDVFDRVIRKNIEQNKTVVTISAQRGFVRQGDFFKKLIASDITDNYFLVHRGEFCYNKSYSKGYDWGATKRLTDFDKAVVTTLYICFRLKDEKQDCGDYFEYFFDANILDKGLSKIAHEGGRAHGLLNVTSGDFFSLKITVPSYSEQKKIATVLSSAKKELNIQENKLTVLQQQKKGLMQKLLTGEIRVNVN